MDLLFRLNRVVLTLACILLLPGLYVTFAGGSWEAESAIQVRDLATAWVLVMLGLCALPVASGAAVGVRWVFRRHGRTAGATTAAVLVILAANLSFWALASIRFTPTRDLYEKGSLFWVRQTALVFGHGYWRLSDGYWQHHTRVALPGGELYEGPTLDLLRRLRGEGARSIWGTWCYSGNYPYIRKDLLTGRETPWPGYASYNRTPGLTLPVWLGAGFVRLGLPEQRFTKAPRIIETLPADTLWLTRPSFADVEQAFENIRLRIRGLPHADSVSWRPIRPDTVHSIPWSVYELLPRAEQEAVRRSEWERASLKARVGIANYWIRGRVFPVAVKVQSQVYRPPADPSAFTETGGPGGASSGADGPGAR